ncbi:MAG: DUF6054 family protein [Candidatus Thorarchaeota archaeon]
MKTLTFDGQYLDLVIDYLSRNYSAVTRKISRLGPDVMAIFIHEEYVWRTGSYQTLTAVVESKGNFEQAVLTVVGSGGGEGLCNFNWGSHSAGEDTIIKNVKALIGHQSRSYEGSNY